MQMVVAAAAGLRIRTIKIAERKFRRPRLKADLCFAFRARPPFSIQRGFAGRVAMGIIPEQSAYASRLIDAAEDRIADILRAAVPVANIAVAGVRVHELDQGLNAADALRAATGGQLRADVTGQRAAAGTADGEPIAARARGARSAQRRIGHIAVDRACQSLGIALRGRAIAQRCDQLADVAVALIVQVI
jgi:hypothetical protein